MGTIRTNLRRFLILSLAAAALVVFAGPFSITYPGVAYAQGTPASVNAPAVGNFGFLVMSVMMGVVILIMFGFMRHVRSEGKG